jgi:hypothetical protein
MAVPIQSGDFPVCSERPLDPVYNVFSCAMEEGQATS